MKKYLVIAGIALAAVAVANRVPMVAALVNGR